MRSVIFIALAFCLWGEDVKFRTLDPQVIEGRFGRLHAKNADRAAELKQMFAEAGCKDENYSEPKVRDSKLPNLMCVLPGASERMIVVSAHFDNAGPGEGALDNWSGASLLPSLFQSLTVADRRATFVFIAFTDEEKGLVGSKSYVDHLPKDRRPLIAADVNVDSVGLPGPIRVWAKRADKELLNTAALVASYLKIPVQGVNIDDVGDSDSHPFVDRKIPVIDFHSLTTATLPLLHSKKDVPAALDMKAYYDTYRFLAVYLAYLDSRQ